METTLRSGKHSVRIGSHLPFAIIGQRINPMIRPGLVQVLERRDFGKISEEARRQVEHGAALLDVGAAVPGLDEGALLADLVRHLQGVVDAPLMLSALEVNTLRRGLEAYQGKPLLNAVTGEKDSLDAILPLAAEHGAALIALCTDENGISEDPDERFAVACRIIEQAEKRGIPAEDVIVDPVVMPISAQPKAANTVFQVLRRCRDELGVNTCVGANNISFGMPARDALNAAFLSMAISRGLTCAISDPTNPATRLAALASDAFMERDPDFERWLIANQRGANPEARRAERLAGRRGE